MFSFVINVRKNKVKQFEIRDFFKKTVKEEKKLQRAAFLFVCFGRECLRSRPFLKVL